MRVIVTGGAGFIGRHTVRMLLSENAQVLVLDDFSSSAPEVLDEFSGMPGFDWVEGDICDEPSVRRIFADWRADAVVHLAGLVSVARSIEEPEESWQRNANGTRVVAEAALAAHCRRFVFASSAAVYSDSTELPLREEAALRPALAPYGQHKADSERLLGMLGSGKMQMVLLRYFNAYGVGQPSGSPYSGVITRFVDAAVRGVPLQVFGDGGQSRDFVHVDDIARINLLAATGKLRPATYNVCSGTGTTINTLISLLRDLIPGIVVEDCPAKAGEIRHSIGSSERLLAAVPGGWQPQALNDGVPGLVASTIGTASTKGSLRRPGE